jgi:hypothetical protein
MENLAAEAAQNPWQLYRVAQGRRRVSQHNWQASRTGIAQGFTDNAQDCCINESNVFIKGMD